MAITTIKSFIFSHRFLYELFFFLTRKKINRRSLNGKILRLRVKKIHPNKRVQKLIVSLTTYGERLLDLKYTLYSLINQSFLPEKIIVWIGYGESIPGELKIFEKFCVEFIYCDDIRSYTKLIPAMKHYPDYCIVTADDDIFYRKHWLKKLWKCHLKNPEKKIAHIAHKVCFNSKKNMLPYNKWKHSVLAFSSKKILFPTGVGGILYPPHAIPTDFLDKNLFMKLCPYADDIWFYFMGLLSGQETIVVFNPYRHLRYVDVYKECGLNEKATLQSLNVRNNQNDVQIKNVMKHFKITDEDLYKLVRNI